MSTHERRLAAILSAIREHPGIDAKDITVSIGYNSKFRLFRYLWELYDDGLIRLTEEPSGNGGNPRYRWYVR